MLDVHPPEHGIHGKQDFFIHMATITLGLLIALGLEQGVEALHHHHQKERAEANIREEIRENRDHLKDLQKRQAQEMQDTISILKRIDALLKHEPPDAGKPQFGFATAPLRDAAWRTASATGIASYMDYDTVQQFAECYKQQDEFERMQDKALDEFLHLGSFAVLGEPTAPTDDELRQAQQVARSSLADLSALRDIGNGTLASYDEALK
jgi:hypothetical protein